MCIENMYSLTYANSNIMPIGSILPYIGTSPPSNQYLMCDGLPYDIIAYRELYQVLNTNVTPNLMNRMLFGKGSIPPYDTLRSSVGKSTTSLTLTSEHIPSHTHTVTLSNSGAHSHTTTSDGAHDHVQYTRYENAPGFVNGINYSGVHEHPYDRLSYAEYAMQNVAAGSSFPVSVNIHSSGSYLDATNGGRVAAHHTHTVDEADPHTHNVPVTDTNHRHTIESISDVGQAIPVPLTINILPKCYVVNYIIKASTRTM